MVTARRDAWRMSNLIKLKKKIVGENLYSFKFSNSKLLGNSIKIQ